VFVPGQALESGAMHEHFDRAVADADAVSEGEFGVDPAWTRRAP